MGIMNFITDKVSGTASGAIISRIMGGALIVTIIATILLTKYSFTLTASLAEANKNVDIANGKYEAMVTYSKKQAALLSEERKSNTNLKSANARLNKDYANVKSQVDNMPEVNGCLAPSDVNRILCNASIYSGAACTYPADSATASGIPSAPLAH